MRKTIAVYAKFNRCTVYIHNNILDKHFTLMLDIKLFANLINGILSSIAAKLKQLKDWLKEAITPVAYSMQKSSTFFSTSEG